MVSTADVMTGEGCGLSVRLRDGVIIGALEESSGNERAWMYMDRDREQRTTCETEGVTVV